MRASHRTTELREIEPITIENLYANGRQDYTQAAGVESRLLLAGTALRWLSLLRLVSRHYAFRCRPLPHLNGPSARYYDLSAHLEPSHQTLLLFCQSSKLTAGDRRLLSTSTYLNHQRIDFGDVAVDFLGDLTLLLCG